MLYNAFYELGENRYNSPDFGDVESYQKHKLAWSNLTKRKTCNTRLYGIQKQLTELTGLISRFANTIKPGSLVRLIAEANKAKSNI